MLASMFVCLVSAVTAVALPCWAMGTITPTIRPIAIAKTTMVTTIFFNAFPSFPINLFLIFYVFCISPPFIPAFLYILENLKYGIQHGF